MKPAALFANSSDPLDLTNPATYRRLEKLTDTLLAAPDLNLSDLQENARQVQAPLEFKLVALLVESHLFVRQNSAPLKLGIVFAMWGEHNRLRPSGPQNPNGENSLREKLRQLKRLFENTSVDWRLYAVDDGCPWKSGEIAENILRDHPLRDKVKVLYLKDALNDKRGYLRDLKSAEDSRKGGSILLGCETALNEGAEALIYTDSDCSVHLEQLGLLLQAHLVGGVNVVLGGRRLFPGGALVESPGSGKKLLRHMRYLLAGPLIPREIMFETQSPFKLYHREIFLKFPRENATCDISFETDLILSFLKQNELWQMAPFVSLDSMAESAANSQGLMSWFESAIKGLAAQLRKYDFALNQEMKLMADIIEQEIDGPDVLELLCQKLPPELENVADLELGAPEIMKARAVGDWIRLQKASRLNSRRVQSAK